MQVPVKWIEITSIPIALTLGISTYALAGFIEKHNVKETEEETSE